MRPDLSVVILSYRSKQHLSVLLPSVLAQQTPLSYEVFLVDNGSPDGTGDWIESFLNEGGLREQSWHLIRNENIGFSAGNNVAIRRATGRYVLLLNPDTELEQKTFQTMVEFMDRRPDVGIAGCKLVKPDGSLDLACRRRFPDPWISFRRLFLGSRSSYNYSGEPVDREMEVDSVVGAFLAIRRETLDRIGLLDESFFMYGEDLDWCWRCKEAGWKVWYYPKTTVRHYKGESSRTMPIRALRWFYDAMWTFYRKHYAARYPAPFSWLVWLGIYGRFSVFALRNLIHTDPRVSR